MLVSFLITSHGDSVSVCALVRKLFIEITAMAYYGKTLFSANHQTNVQIDTDTTREMFISKGQ